MKKQTRKAGKMREVQSINQYWNPKEEGDTIDGVFTGYVELPNRLAKKGDKKTQQRIVVEVSKGESQILPAHYELEHKFQKIREGAHVTVTYLEEIKIGRGRKVAKYKVLSDLFKSDE